MATVEATIEVAGMTCDGCERSIASALVRLEGVTEAVPSHTAGTVFVRFEDDRVGMDEIGRAIEDAGYDLGSSPGQGSGKIITEIPFRKPNHP